jgi:SAM-dependent methyltransferase
MSQTSRVTGIDASAEYIARAGERLQSERVTFEQGDAQRLRFPHSSFDRTLSLLVLNFIPDAAAALREMIRVTKLKRVRIPTELADAVAKVLRESQSDKEKVAHLTTLTCIEPEQLPHVTTRQGSDRSVRYFPERLPIGIHLAGRGVLVYGFTGDALDDFRAFLQRHAALLRALPVWTLRIVVPPHIAVMETFAREAVETQLLTPLHDESLDEMRWYFEQARAHPAPTRAGPRADLDERFYRDRTAFSAPRFKVLYRLWKQEGDAIAALTPRALPAVAEIPVAASCRSVPSSRSPPNLVNANRMMRSGMRPCRVAAACRMMRVNVRS